MVLVEVLCLTSKLLLTCPRGLKLHYHIFLFTCAHTDLSILICFTECLTLHLRYILLYLKSDLGMCQEGLYFIDLSRS
jgi:hypothetical protein